MSDGDSTLLRATLVPVAREIEAKAGQRLLIVAGVCVGVYTGDKPAARAAVPEPAAPAEPKREAAGKRRGHGVAVRTVRDGGKDTPDRAAMRRTLVDALLRKGGTLPAYELGRVLGPKEDPRRPYHVRCALADLEADGVIRFAGTRGRGRIYQLIRPPLAPVEAAG